MEFLCQQGWFKTIKSGDQPQIACLLADSRPMHEGEKTYFLHQAAEEFAPLLCKLHPKGISISIYVFDRKFFTSLSTSLFRRHALYHKRQSAAGSASDAAVPGSGEDTIFDPVDLDLHTAAACAMHDLHNSCRWALKPFLQNEKADLKDLFLMVESSRNTFDMF